MAKNELVGLERKLVLQKLKDEDTAFTILPQNITLSPEDTGFLEPGLILLRNPSAEIASLNGENVEVYFYFNKLYLYFKTILQQSSLGFVLAIPQVIYKAEDKLLEKNKSFSVTLFYECGPKNNQKLDINCDFDENYPLFVQADYKNLINRYLSEKITEKSEAIADRIHAPTVIYLDSNKIIFAARKNDMSLSPGREYAVLLRFPMEGPLKERKVYLSCIADDMFENYECNKLCACTTISSIRKEDERFISEKMNSL